MDLNKVAPASEWKANDTDDNAHDTWWSIGPWRRSHDEALSDAELMHELRLAFDVQQRWAWTVKSFDKGWAVVPADAGNNCSVVLEYMTDHGMEYAPAMDPLIFFARPSQALVEADGWMTEQEKR